MKIAFIDPGFGERSWGTFGQSHWTSIIHAGLCGLSASAKDAGFSDVHLIDVRQLNGWGELETRINTMKPDLVALTMRSCDYNLCAKIASLVKKTNSSIKIVVGGVHVSIDPEFVLSFLDYDYVISGEGEVAFVKLLQALSKQEEFPRFTRGEPPDLDKLPFIDRELYDYNVSLMLPNYEGIFNPPMVTMLCSRGCPFKCSFCYPHSQIHFGKKIRQRSVDNVIAELDMLHSKYKFESAKFYDYSFTMNPQWALEFCNKYKHIGKPFWIQSRADLICKQADVIKALAGVGLRMVGIGFESGSDKVLCDLRKGTTREINLKAARVVKEAGVLLSGSFMLGTPTETEEDVKKTISMAKEMKPDFTSVSFFTPIPGNDLYDYCKQNHIIISDDPEMWVEFSPNIPKIKGVDYEKLKLAAAEIMGDRFGGKIIGRIIRWFYVKTKYHYRLRSVLVRCYTGWVTSALYRWKWSKKKSENEVESPVDT